MNLATSITFIRIFISPIFLIVYIEQEPLGISPLVLPYLLLFLLGISEISDAVDGFLARKYNQVTDLGKILDPMADSISRISVFLTFTQPPVNLPLPLIFIFIYRDSVISTLRTICALKGFALSARVSGKIKAVLQAVAAFSILGLMILLSIGKITATELTKTSTWITAFVALYTLFSGIDYIIANWSYVLRLLKPNSPTN